MKASIIAIGTELTTGQIINKNAAAISQKLNALGLTSSFHLTVPDNYELMLESMRYLENQSDLIFITGGLGPTSDDFTRDVVAEWLQVPMQFDENSWTQILNRLNNRGFQVREIQKQQCFFPKGSEILENREGTANAFYFERLHKGNTQFVWVLPGPPREIESIWNDHIHNWISEMTKNLNKRVTKSWDTLGVGESDVALLVESVLNQFSNSKHLEVGYRVHLPYVEVKISFNESEKEMFNETITQVDDKLKSITFAKDFDDIVEKIGKKLLNIEFAFYDMVSGGYLHSRLGSALKSMNQWNFKQSTHGSFSPDFFTGEEDFLALFPQEENRCLVMGACGSNQFQKIIEAPMKSTLMAERRKQYFSELALVELARHLP